MNNDVDHLKELIQELVNDSDNQFKEACYWRRHSFGMREESELYGWNHRQLIRKLKLEGFEPNKI